MPVEVSDWHVDLVRTFLRQDDGKLKPMLGQMPRTYEVDGTGVLLWAAFVEATFRRFPDGNVADIIRFVAHVRIRRGRNAPPISPAAAEKLIISALTATEADGLTDLEKGQHIILLSELIEDEALTDAQLDAFLDVARTHAKHIAASL